MVVRGGAVVLFAAALAWGLGCGMEAFTAGPKSSDSKASAEDEEKIPLEQVPQVVKDAAQKAVPGIVIAEVEKEVENGAVVFEVEGTAGGKEYELKISAAGQVLKTEVEDDDDED